MIYLDNAATSFPKPEAVYRAMDRAQRYIGANPGRAGHQLSLSAARIVMDTREALAELLHVSEPERIVFGSNCTDMLNIAIKGAVRDGMQVVTSVRSHNSVLRPLQSLADQGRIKLKITSDILHAVGRNTDLVVIPHADNVTGAILPVEQIAILCQIHHCRLIVDAAQTAGILPLYPEEWGVDLCAMPGHKGLLGPQGTGALYIRKGVDLKPLKEGGTGTSSQLLEQPRELPERYESGTLNTPGLAGLGQGVRYVLEHRARIRAHELLLTERLLHGLRSIPNVHLYGPATALERVGTVSFNIEGMESGMAADRLDAFGICVRAGLHCAPLMHESLGTLATGTLRASLGFMNSADDVDALLHRVSCIAKTALHKQ